LKLAPILKEISKNLRMGGHNGSRGHDGKLHQAFTLVMEWEAVEHLKVSRWDQKSQITTVELVSRISYAKLVISARHHNCCYGLIPAPSECRVLLSLFGKCRS
jgi:hypothetical protein